MPSSCLLRSFFLFGRSCLISFHLHFWQEISSSSSLRCIAFWRGAPQSTQIWSRWICRSRLRAPRSRRIRALMNLRGWSHPMLQLYFANYSFSKSSSLVGRSQGSLLSCRLWYSSYYPLHCIYSKDCHRVQFQFQRHLLYWFRFGAILPRIGCRY